MHSLALPAKVAKKSIPQNDCLTFLFQKMHMSCETGMHRGRHPLPVQEPQPPAVLRPRRTAVRHERRPHRQRNRHTVFQKNRSCESPSLRVLSEYIRPARPEIPCGRRKGTIPHPIHDIPYIETNDAGEIFRKACGRSANALRSPVPHAPPPLSLHAVHESSRNETAPERCSPRPGDAPEFGGMKKAGASPPALRRSLPDRLLSCFGAVSLQRFIAAPHGSKTFSRRCRNPAHIAPACSPAAQPAGPLTLPDNRRPDRPGPYS